ncbi:MAG TPA: hypothetical protein VJ256_07625, partial [Dehalococcoidia bacterium]|nr:hypothetical protein [Dehalococcoidia bacterium]
NFEQETPSAEALAKLREILSFECGYHGLDPRARSDFLRSDGLWTRGVIGVCGHREINVTACPGQNLYDRLPGLRDEAASRLANPSAPTVAITDGPDGVAVAGNTVSYRWAGSGSAYSHYLEGWSPDKGTGDVKYLTGFTPDKSPGWSAWEPTTTKGFSLPAAGHYTFHVRVRDAQGRVSVYQADRTMLKTSGKKAVTSWVFPVAK